MYQKEGSGMLRSLTEKMKMKEREFKWLQVKEEQRGQTPRRHTELWKGQVKQLNISIEIVDIVLNVGLKRGRDLRYGRNAVNSEKVSTLVTKENQNDVGQEEKKIEVMLRVMC